MPDQPRREALVILVTGDLAEALLWRGHHHVQYEYDKYGACLEGWTDEVQMPNSGGLWRGDGLVKRGEPWPIVWRRLTPAELDALAAGTPIPWTDAGPQTMEARIAVVGEGGQPLA